MVTASEIPSFHPVHFLILPDTEAKNSAIREAAKRRRKALNVWYIIKIIIVTKAVMPTVVHTLSV